MNLDLSCLPPEIANEVLQFATDDLTRVLKLGQISSHFHIAAHFLFSLEIPQRMEFSKNDVIPIDRYSREFHTLKEYLQVRKHIKWSHDSRFYYHSNFGKPSDPFSFSLHFVLLCLLSAVLLNYFFFFSPSFFVDIHFFSVTFFNYCYALWFTWLWYNEFMIFDDNPSRSYFHMLQAPMGMFFLSFGILRCFTSDHLLRYLATLPILLYLHLELRVWSKDQQYLTVLHVPIVIFSFFFLSYISLFLFGSPYLPSSVNTAVLAVAIIPAILVFMLYIVFFIERFVDINMNHASLGVNTNSAVIRNLTKFFTRRSNAYFYNAVLSVDLEMILGGRFILLVDGGAGGAGGGENGMKTLLKVVNMMKFLCVAFILGAVLVLFAPFQPWWCFFPYMCLLLVSTVFAFVTFGKRIIKCISIL